MKTRIAHHATLLAAAVGLALPVSLASPARAEWCYWDLDLVRDGGIVRGRAEFQCDSQPRTGYATLYYGDQAMAQDSCQTSGGKSCVAAPAAPYQPGKWCLDYSLSMGGASGGGGKCTNID